MIVYDRLWKTIKEKGTSKYKLMTYHEINCSLMSRMLHNKNIDGYTIDRLCKILDCRVEDIMEYIPDEEYEKEN